VENLLLSTGLFGSLSLYTIGPPEIKNHDITISSNIYQFEFFDNENVGARIIASNGFLEPDRNKNRQMRHWQSPALPLVKSKISKG
jgi:hypothetical protein